MSTPAWALTGRVPSHGSTRWTRIKSFHYRRRTPLADRPAAVRRVTVSPQVLIALRHARLWYAQPGSGARGRAKWHALRDAPAGLADAPYTGRPAPGLDGLRQLVVADHRIIYRIAPDTGLSSTAGDVRVLLALGPGLP
jgi:plasmid stabilization system protein ParE